MKINDSFYFDIQLGNETTTEVYSDFLKIGDLRSFKLTEYSGTSGIVIDCCLRMFDSTSCTVNGNGRRNLTLKKMFIQNNPIVFKLGSSENNMTTINADMVDVQISNDAQSITHLVTISAVLSFRYYQERKSESITGSSTDVLKNINKYYFSKDMDVSTNIDSSKFELRKDNTQMPWIRNYSTGCQFALDTWLHMNLGTGRCPLITLGTDGKFRLTELSESIKDKDPKCTFVVKLSGSNKKREILALDNFAPESYKMDSNRFSGFGNVIYINDVEEGSDQIDVLSAESILASTKKMETTNAGYKFWTNKYQSRNTYKGYKKQYFLNLTRLVMLSSIVGNITTLGYYPDIKPTDIVEVSLQDKENDGKYIVNTKVTTFSSSDPVRTIFAVCRDSRNNIENAIIQKKVSPLSMLNTSLAKLMQIVRNLKRIVVMGRQVLRGDFQRNVLTFLSSFKYNLLTSFSMFGVTLNFNDSLSLLQSLKASCNAFCNNLLDAFLPYPFNYVFRNFALEQPSLSTLLSKLLYEFSPTSEFRDLIVELVGLFSDLTGEVSSVYESNYKYQSATEYTYNKISQGEDMNLQNNQKRVDNITDEFIQNTEGVDIPIPQTDLTESEALLPDNELKDLMADKTVTWLIEQGYLNGVDNFKKILLGEESLDFNTITQINNNIGNMLYARYWGTFNDVGEMTDFYIKNSFKDIYVTVPTTKIINAIRGAKIFIALPASETDLTFYINNKEVEMDVLSNVNMDLYTQGGVPLYYNVYMSTESFNSNSVVLEVRKS